jgi:DNA invertase Pin-like site-specific DNA recombinase
MEISSKRVGLYVRVSTQDQKCDLQLRELREYISRRPGWNIAKIYEDRASGASPNRKMLNELMADCRRRRIDVVMVWKLDRLFRSLKGIVTTLQEWGEIGIEFCSATDQLDMTTAQGRLMLHLVSSFAEFERELIRSRCIAGLEAARARGVRLGRPTNLTPEISQRILELRADGCSFREIERRLDRVVSKATAERVCKGVLSSGTIPPLKPTPLSEENQASKCNDNSRNETTVNGTRGRKI